MHVEEKRGRSDVTTGGDRPFGKLNLIILL